MDGGENMFRLYHKPTGGSNDTTAFPFFILIPLLILTLGCDVNNYADMDGQELGEISFPDPFKANVYLESLKNLEEAEYYIFLHVVEADQKIDSIIRVDFKQLQEHGFAFPRERFGIHLEQGGFMHQVIETSGEFDSLQYVHEQIKSAVIEELTRPYVYTDIGKFHYEKFYQDRGYQAPRLSVGDQFNPTEEDGVLRSINF